MKKQIGIILLLSLSSAWGETQNMGLGAILGAPTGIAANYKLSDNKSVDGALSFDFSANTKLNFHSTYLLHKPESIPFNDHKLDWYYGAGARFKLVSHKDKDDELLVGPRVASGLLWNLSDVPCDFFGQGALGLDIIPRTSAYFNLSLGARYYF